MKRMDGVVIGIVKQIDAKNGRLKVDYPWMDPPIRSGWAPVASLMAGKNRGVFFMPEIDDEAVIMFEHGDGNHPYVVGFTHNGVDTPPETDLKNRVIMTPGGHTLRFEDGDNKKVILQSNSGQKITLDDQNNSITIQGGGRIITMSNGMVQISSGT